MSDLVGNPEGRFSRDTIHILSFVIAGDHCPDFTEYRDLVVVIMTPDLEKHKFLNQIK